MTANQDWIPRTGAEKLGHFSPEKMNFEDRVAIVTGAGHGLGRTYALLLASKGAKVVVNDLGTSCSGQGSKKSAADAVVDEIRSKGGIAVASYDSVESGDKIVSTAKEHFGTVHIVVNNAGILRDVSLAKMTEQDWDRVYNVHLKGTFSVTRAAWEPMRQQRYGRIINICSAAGLYGDFGQTNYSSAKMGILGFTLSAAREGESRNILVNAIAPLAASRMTETVLPAQVLGKLNPETVAPLVGYLAHESCQSTGAIFECGAGWVAKLRWQRSKGLHSESLTIQHIRDNMDIIEVRLWKAKR